MLDSFSKLFQHSQTAVVLLGQEGKIESANAAAVRLFPHNWPVVGKTLSEIAPMQVLTPHIQAIAETKNYVEIVAIENSQGQIDYFRASLNLVEDSNFVLLMLETFFYKPDKDKETRKETKETEEFIQKVSHDLKSPLVTIVGFTEVLKDDFYSKVEPQAREYIDYILKGAYKMESMLGDLLEYSRIGRNPRPFMMIAFDDILNETLVSLKSVIDARKAVITIVTKFPEIYCDPDYLIEVVTHLLSNAINYTPLEKVPEISIGCNYKDEGYEFWISDNAIGIEPKFHKQVFEIFFRTKDLKSIDGNGMGLAISQKIVSFHGGWMRLESRPSEGSCFYFFLPIPQSFKKSKPI